MSKNKLKLNHQQNTDSISILEIFRIIANDIKVVIVIPSLFLVMMLLYLFFFAEPSYVSTSKLLSSSSSMNSSQAQGLMSRFGINMPFSQQEQKWVYPEIIKSRTIGRAVLKRDFKFENKYIPLINILVETKITKSKINYSDELKALESLLNMISVSEDISTGIITLNIESSDPMLSYQINQAYIDELDAHQKRYNKAKTRDAKLFIRDRIISTEKELIIAEENLKNFRDRNRRIENSPALLLEQERFTREVAVLTGVFTTLKQQLETTKIEEVKESDYVITFDPPEVPLIRSKPNRKLLVIISAILGSGLSLIFIFLRYYLSTSGLKNYKELKNIIEIAKANLKS